MAGTRSSKEGWGEKEAQELISQAMGGTWSSSNQNLKKVLMEVFDRLSLLRDELGCVRTEANGGLTEVEGLKKNVADLKKQVKELKKENDEEKKQMKELQEEGEKWKRETARMEELEKENDALRRELKEIKAKQGEQNTAIKEVQESFEVERKETSKWVDVVKKGGASGKKETISETLEEQTRRESKARNVVVRGLELGNSPKEDAESIIRQVGASVPFETAWRVGKDETRSKPLIVKFKNVADRMTFVGKRAALKGTRIYLDDDLTMMQVEHRRAGMTQVMAARKEGKWAIYRDGRVTIRDRRDI